MYGNRDNLPSKSFRETVFFSFKILNHKQKKDFVYVFLSIQLNTLIDLFSIASILPLVYSFLKPELFNNSVWINDIKIFLGFSNDTNTMNLIIIFVIILFIIKTITSYVIIRKNANFFFNISRFYSVKMFNNLFIQNRINKDETKNTSNEINNIINIPILFSDKVINGMLSLISHSILALIIFIGLLFFNPKIIAYLSIILIPPSVIYFLLKRKNLKDIRTSFRHQYPTLIQNSIDAVNGYIEILLTNSREYFVSKFSKINQSLTNKHIDLYTNLNTSIKFIELIAITGICVMFLFFNYQLNDKDEVLLTLTVYATAVYRLIPAFNNIGVAYSNISAHAYVIDILDNSSYKTETSLQEAPITSLSFKNSLSIKNISYHYPNTNFKLVDISLNINKGEKIGITGESGSGKTTLINIILRLLNEDNGQILLDEKPIKNENKSAFQNLIAYVPQEPFFIEGSIIENIALGQKNEEIDLNSIEKIIDNLNLNELVSNLKDRLNSKLVEKGGNISTGQKQRLAIARAIYFKKQIMIFDEITSNLDKKNQEKVLKYVFSSLPGDTTMILISHNKEVLSLCDSVYEFSNSELNKLNVII